MSTTHPLCEDCGECCGKLGSPPFSNHERASSDNRDVPVELWAAMRITETDVDENGFTRAVRQEPCCWFDEDTKLCKNYPNRPAACKDDAFEPGCQTCLNIRAGNWYQPDPVFS